MALKPVSVSQLNGYIKRILQTDPILGNISVIGEISNLKYHSSGHVYFTLKDEKSKINCFLPSDQRRKLRFELTDGMEITAFGYIYLYERGGTYSINVREINVQGMGNLSVAFEQLKNKLEKEGLFDPRYKKQLPFFPERVAVITSATGAAVRDIIKIIQSRNRYVDVVVFPCLVQGPDAAADISRAIDTVNRLFPETDVMIVGRGGGSMEELWAFNEEIVARSIFLSEIPVISAVGHETDFTIADFVADLRAETPTAAAQTAVPDIAALKEYGRELVRTITGNLNKKVEYCSLRVSANNRGQLLASLVKKMQMGEIHINALKESLQFGMSQRLQTAEHRLIQGRLLLEAVNPYSPLERGYGMIFRDKTVPLGSVQKVKEGEHIDVFLADGVLTCLVEEIRKSEEKGGSLFGRETE